METRNYVITCEDTETDKTVILNFLDTPQEGDTEYIELRRIDRAYNHQNRWKYTLWRNLKFEYSKEIDPYKRYLLLRIHHNRWNRAIVGIYDSIELAEKTSTLDLQKQIENGGEITVEYELFETFTIYI